MPPLARLIAVADHVPVVIVPRVVMAVWPAQVDFMVRLLLPSVVILVPSTFTFKAVPLKLRPVPAVIAPDDENRVKANDVVPRVIGLGVVRTKPFPAFTVPSSVKVNAVVACCALIFY